MIQSQFEMESGHNIINTSTSNNLQMIPFDQCDPETMARRLKNRERQRRYRARKRQEADMKRARVINEPTQPQIVEEIQVNDTPVYFATEASRQRNWKEDARRAHILKQQTATSNGLVISNPATASVDPSKSASIVEDTEVRSSTPGGRNWKAEARNKRN